MLQNARYLGFGLLVLASYWFVVRNGIVLWTLDQTPSGPAAHTVSGSSGTSSRSQPSFWNNGFQGGK